jgi:hypothetical protein
MSPVPDSLSPTLTSSLQAKFDTLKSIRTERLSTAKSKLQTLQQGVKDTRSSKGKLLNGEFHNNIIHPNNSDLSRILARKKQLDKLGRAVFHNVQLYGIEWEFEFIPAAVNSSPEEGRIRLSNMLREVCGTTGAVHKGDGSLSGDWGREINFKPGTYSELKGFLLRLQQYGINNLIDPARTIEAAGVHVHVNLDCLAHMNILKLWGAINLTTNIPFWKVFGRRYERGEGDSNYRYCQWAPCSMNDIKTWQKDEYTFDKVLARGHRSAIAYTGKDTLEIRLFNGASNSGVLLEYFEAVVSLVDWSRNSPLFTEYSIESWVKFLHTNKSTYPHAYRRAMDTLKLMTNSLYKKSGEKLPSDVFSGVATLSASASGYSKHVREQLPYIPQKFPTANPDKGE